MGSVRVVDGRNPTDGAAVMDGPPITGQTVMSRRTAIGGGLAGLAGLGGLLLFPVQSIAKDAVAGATVANAAVPADPFLILLKGHYKPAVSPPNLSLSSVHLNDGSYSTVKIYPQRGVPGHTDQTSAIGNFFVQFAGDLCAFNLPLGSLAMRFDKVQPPGLTIPMGVVGIGWLDRPTWRSWKGPASIDRLPVATT